MRSLSKLFLGLGLFALQLHALPAWAGPPKAGAQSAAKASAPIVRRVFKVSKTAPLPTSWKIAGQRYVSASEYRDLADGVMALLRRYPPKKYFFVGLGRDPAPVIAFLQNLGEKDLAVNLPGTSNIQWKGMVSAKDVARHIEAAVPENILVGKRQIVILDVTSSGKTPAIFGPYFDRYLKSRGNPQKVVRLAFSWQDVMKGYYKRGLTDWIDTNKWADFRQYYTGKYEGRWTPETGGHGIAEHQRHSMTPGVEPPTVTNPNYTAFRKAVFARMERDEKLDGFLVNRLGATGQKRSLVTSAAGLAKGD